MGLILGKRKSRGAEETAGLSTEDAQAIFRRHFEAKFQPLGDSRPSKSPRLKQKQQPEPEDHVSSESEWEGLSDGEDDTPVVEVVEHTSTTTVSTSQSMSKRELKAFMSSRPPPTSTTTPPTAVPTNAPDEDPSDPSAPSLLANDLALSRLIRESHLLASSSPSAILSSSSGLPSTQLAGRARHLATDMRVRALTDGNKHNTTTTGTSPTPRSTSLLARPGGASAATKESIYSQRNRPTNIARGIAAAATRRDERRRREARETGQVLERFGGAADDGKRGRARKKKRSGDGGGGGRVPGDPAVGRMRGAELRLSERDVRSIERQGQRRSGRGGGGGGGRGRGRGGKRR